jgi:uncharacterized spore protein YtfJ
MAARGRSTHLAGAVINALVVMAATANVVDVVVPVADFVVVVVIMMVVVMAVVSGGGGGLRRDDNDGSGGGGGGRATCVDAICMPMNVQ